ncbi:hypothetical protein Ga0100231_005115 [Opitutaceae bacterium TAV4]|nr:hypothetical protein Ga0100231_005115 [Opitutaceae bacterium TAV4]RRK00908.1 hypothetical protein Ga0100230_024360 [Opitutaceae bacterium TAV3]RRK02373.1 hypothetical protein Ga0100230_004250 [Opitutaceae bacterium TAV3]
MKTKQRPPTEIADEQEMLAQSCADEGDQESAAENMEIARAIRGLLKEVATLSEREQKLYNALKRISQYAPPDNMRKHSEKAFGLDPDECIEMAYENVIAEAKAATKGMRRPKSNTHSTERVATP